MRKILSIAIVLFVAACASPTMKMSDQEIANLSDDQLCSYKNTYREEPRLNNELARRGLQDDMSCNRFFRECLRRGNKPGTQAMDFCMDLVRENERLRYDPRWGSGIGYGHGPYRSGVYSGVGFGF